MAAKADEFDLAAMRLSAGAGRRLTLDMAIEPLTLGSETYTAEPSHVAVELNVSRMTGTGYALRLRFVTALEGPCMRCLQPAAPLIEVEAREVDRPGGGEELSSPYVRDDVLDLAAWTRDSLRAGCAGEGDLQRGLRGAMPGVRGGLEPRRSAAPPRAQARSPLGEAARA